VAILKDTAANLSNHYQQLAEGPIQVKTNTQEPENTRSEQEASNCEKLASLEQQHGKCVAELAKARAECAQLQTTNKELDKKLEDLAAKELTVRRIANKYKTQFDELAQNIQQVRQKSVAPAEPLKRPVQVQQTEQQLQVHNLICC
jgi:chromosome segregation ATPase